MMIRRYQAVSLSGLRECSDLELKEDYITKIFLNLENGNRYRS